MSNPAISHPTIEAAALYWNADATDHGGLVFAEDLNAWVSEDDAYQCEDCKKFFSLNGTQGLCDDCKEINEGELRQDRIYGSFEQQAAAEWRASR